MIGDWIEDHPGWALFIVAVLFVIVNVAVGDPALDYIR